MRVLPWIGIALAFGVGVLVGRTWLAPEGDVAEVRQPREAPETPTAPEHATLIGRGSLSPPAPDAIAERSPPPTPEPSPPHTPAPAPAPLPPPEPAEVRKAKLVTEWELRQGWMKDIRSLRSAEKRDAALESVRASFTASDPAVVLAGLKAARALSKDLYDADVYRRRILPHVKSEDPDIRWAARTALATVKPLPEDLWMWLEEVETANLDTAGEIARFLKLTAGRVIEGRAADALLYLLRDGTEFQRADVIAGLSSVKRFAPRVIDRLVEVAQAERGKGDAPYKFLQYVAQSLKPKPDALVDLVLDLIADGWNDHIVFGCLHWGLSDAQTAHAAATLMGFAENAKDVRSCRRILEGLGVLAGPKELPRLEAMASDPGVDEKIRKQARLIADRVRRR